MARLESQRRGFDFRTGKAFVSLRNQSDSLDQQKGAKASYISRPGTLYPAFEPAGRQIVFGFTYLETIGRGARTNVWFPPSLEERLIDRILQGDQSLLDEFKVEWAAVREFNLLRENGNDVTRSLEPEDIERAFKQEAKMRAGARRITIITMGRYTPSGAYDELQIMDERLQSSIADFISMLYLEEQSAKISDRFHSFLTNGTWDYAKALPHVAITMGATHLFRPKRANPMQTRFFQLLDLLDQKNIMHDTAIGLELPERRCESGTGVWVYLAASDEKRFRFEQALTSIFQGFDLMSLSALQGRADAHTEVRPTMIHQRGYGDHMRADRDEHYQALARYARTLIPQELKNDAA